MNASSFDHVDFWICLDFEATCDEGVPPAFQKNECELIEFAYAIYGVAQNEIALTGQHYVRNTRTPLTQFCIDLTGITPDKLLNAGSLEDALKCLEATLQSEPFVDKMCCAVTHGSWDLEFLLPSNCKELGLSIPAVLQRYVDLRQVAQDHLRPSGVSASTLSEICGALGVSMDGRLHCGLDDARMVAMAMQALLHSGALYEKIDLAQEQAVFASSDDSTLCIDGLPFDIVAPELLDWFSTHEHLVQDGGLHMIVDARGWPSGRALVDFGDHAGAVSALTSLIGGQILRSSTGVRLILLRPLRRHERFILERFKTSAQSELIPFPVDTLTVARMRSKSSSMAEFRKGDWICPSCNDVVFASRRACRCCGTERPSDGYSAMRPADWVCPNCNDLVFAKRGACRKCGHQRPTGDPIPRGVDASMMAKPGDWICPMCQDLVFARNAACRKCRTPKPVAHVTQNV